jgi:photosystem II stability/assembly factor-like uncharacterized protein
MKCSSRNSIVSAAFSGSRDSCGQTHRRMMSAFLTGIFFVGATFLFAQTPPSRPKAVPKASSSTSAGQKPRYKAIWEPINYHEDFWFQDVFFVNDQVGWIAGGLDHRKGGFILQTTDGGDHWTMKLGDPQSNEPPTHSFRFIDATHGWVVQGDKLLGTSDGANWEDAGTIDPSSLNDYVFTSPTRGILMTGYSWNKVSITNDAAKTWKQVSKCATKVEVNGLTQNTDCEISAVHFPTPEIGYAVGGSLNEGPGQGFFVVVKTEDGGESWKVVSTIGNVPHATTVFFVDANTGFTRNNDGKFYATTDGGLTWRALTGSGVNLDLKMVFAGRDVAWTVGRRSMGFSTDGGKHWISRDFHFPADVRAYSLPSRQRAYVVGEHGMIYRYRVVPVEYTSKGMQDAPMMPAAIPQ